MKKSGILLCAGAAVIFTAFALLVYFSAGQTGDSGAYYSPTTTETDVKVCPSKCFDYSVGSGAGKVDVNCEVAKKYVHKESKYCSGIESYTVNREKVCACPAVRVSAEACPRSCSSGELVCNVDASVIDKSSLPCEGHREGALVACRCEESGGVWKALI
jgi:hypothetical protein